MYARQPNYIYTTLLIKIRSTCNEVITELRKKGRLEDYEKTEKYYTSNNVYLTLRDKLNKAIQNGHKLLKNTKENPQCSHTRIFEVFDQFLKIN